MSRRPRRRTALGGLLLTAAVWLAVTVISHAPTPDRIHAPASATTSTALKPPSDQLPARPAPATVEFGASVNLLFDSAAYTSQQIGAALLAMRAAGASTARGDALWEASEPVAPVHGVHTYNWAFDDRTAGDLAAAGLRWLPIFDYSATWAQSIAGQDHSPPSSAADYAAYAGAFASRYGPGGVFWRSHPQLSAQPVQTYEIWNEPDNGEFWTSGPNPGRYAHLYLTARLAIDLADPTARVIVGGLTEPTVFVPAMLAAQPQLRGHIDGIGVHPYGPPSVVLAKIRADRATLDAQGLTSVPLDVTEFGWTTSPPGAFDYVSPARRPLYIRRTVAALGHLDCGVASALVYTWFSPEQNAADSQQWYGILGPGDAPTPDLAAFTEGLRAARAPGAALRLCG